MYRRILAGVLFCLLSCVSQGDEKTFLRKVMETDLSVDEKAEMILAEMTYDEKVSFIRQKASSKISFLSRYYRSSCTKFIIS